MRNLSNLILTASLLAILLLIPKSALSQPSPDYKYSPPAKLNDGIQTGTLKLAKLDEAKLVAGTNEILKGTYANIHSVLIFRHGKLVYENYFTGEDENNHVGSIGVVTHTRQTLHDMRSVTKSVVALAVLVAHSQGIIKDLDQPVFDFFPEYVNYAQGEKKSITVRHLLTMSPGLEWNEGFSYANPSSSAFQMNRAPDTIEFVLSRKFVNKPGTTFEYSGGTTQLLAAIIKRATGSDIYAYTTKHLLTPLGITNHHWAKMKNVAPDADSGLRLRSRDMAKIGLLIANKGRWNGRQIIPEKLIHDAVSEHIQIPQEKEAAALGDRQAYGYQIWKFSFVEAKKRVHLIELSGNGGQKVYIDQANNVMAVITAGNYDARGLKKSSFDVYVDIVYPSLKGKRNR
ncbi:serine hydrolase [soil metagenome]